MKRLFLLVAFLACCLPGPNTGAQAVQTAAATSNDDAVKADALFIDATAARGRHEYATALYLLSKAVAFDPGYAEAYAWKAYLLVRLDRPQEALVEADKALALDANLYSALLHRAYALQHLGRREEAMATVDKAVAANPGPEAGRALQADLRGLPQTPSAQGGGLARRERAAIPQSVPAETAHARTSPETPAPDASVPPKSAEADTLKNSLESLRKYAAQSHPAPGAAHA